MRGARPGAAAGWALRPFLPAGFYTGRIYTILHVFDCEILHWDKAGGNEGVGGKHTAKCGIIITIILFEAKKNIRESASEVKAGTEQHQGSRWAAAFTFPSLRV